MSETPNPPQDPITPSSPSEPGAAPSAAGGPAPEAVPQPAAAPGPTSAPVSYLTPGIDPGVDPADFEKNKMMAALSYVFILWLVPLLAAKDSPYAKFHCNQGILLSIIAFGICLVLGMASFVLAFIPIVNFAVGCLSCVVWPLVAVAILAFAIMGIINATSGKLKPLPLFPKINWVK